MGVIKMGNIVPRAEIETTSLAFQVSVLTITPHRLYTHAYLSMQLLPWEFSAAYYRTFNAHSQPTSSPTSTSTLTI